VSNVLFNVPLVQQILSNVILVFKQPIEWDQKLLANAQLVIILMEFHLNANLALIGALNVLEDLLSVFLAKD
jgi:hypothetical protein